MEQVMWCKKKRARAWQAAIRHQVRVEIQPDQDTEVLSVAHCSIANISLRFLNVKLALFALKDAQFSLISLNMQYESQEQGEETHPK